MADVQKERVSFPDNVQAKSNNRKRCRCVGRAHGIYIYIPSRQVDDRHLLMTIPTPYWYCLNKYELLQTSQSSDTKKPNGSKFWSFFPVSVCGMGTHPSIPGLRLEIFLWLMSHWGVLATWGLCHKQLLLLSVWQRFELDVRVLCQYWRLWCG